LDTILKKNWVKEREKIAQANLSPSISIVFSFGDSESDGTRVLQFFFPTIIFLTG
jgi:hypothetical protein